MITFLAFLAGFGLCLWLTIQTKLELMRVPPPPVLELPMEKSFQFTRICRDIDNMKDIEELKKYAKYFLKASMINEANVVNLVKGYGVDESQMTQVLLPKGDENEEEI